MAIPASIKHYLDAEGIDYQVVTAAAHTELDAACVIRAQAVKDWRGTLLAVFPNDHQIDLDALNKQLLRDFVIAPSLASLATFQDCTAGALPPLPAVYGIKTIIDSSLNGIDPIYFQAGNGTELIRVSARGFTLLQQNAWHGEHIAQRAATPEPTPAPVVAASDVPPRPAQHAIKARIQRLTELPPMPEMAQRILQLRANPYGGAHDLARIVELDPSLAAQVIRYASSPLFGYRGKLGSIQDAISRVLGYDMVMDIAFGIATGRAFRIPLDGPLGLRAFWRDAIYSAALTQALSKLLPPPQRLRPGLAYLAGLLHDFGFLLFGQLYPSEFAHFNQALLAQPQRELHDLEMEQLGATHTELGTWLMEAWQMPAEIITTVREHHNPHYDGVHAGYPQLVRLAKQLLQTRGIASYENDSAIATSLGALNLGDSQVDAMLESVVAGAAALDDMANQIAA
jgi:HD-like signal output (HDOD) protein/prolyl-tRNA editing enzyme YbaK/EbsC (Cys-tRNA(Pro) deacylase)